MTGKTLPFLCLPFLHLQFFCTMETGEQIHNLYSVQSGFPKSFAISVHRWHSTLLTSSSSLNNKLQFLTKTRGEITHTIFFYMTQRPKNPQVFHYFIYWLHFIGHGSTIIKQEPCQVDSMGWHIELAGQRLFWRVSFSYFVMLFLFLFFGLFKKISAVSHHLNLVIHCY